MKEDKPLLLDVEVTVRFLIPEFCYNSDVEGDEDQLRALVQQELEERGEEYINWYDNEFLLVSVKPIV